MKILLRVLTAFTLLLTLAQNAYTTTYDQTDFNYTYFYGQGCPHCASVADYFDQNNIEDRYNIDKKEVYFNRKNAELFNKALEQKDIPLTQRGVPTLIVGDQIYMGERDIINFFEQKADKNVPNKTEATEKVDSNSRLTLAMVLGASLVDAINPCAFAVLIILMTTILAVGNRKKALLSGLMFATSIFISYLLMGLGLYQAIELGGLSSIIFKLIGWFAILIGIFNLKDYFWYGKGFVMEVPFSWRPKLKSLIQSVTSPSGAFFTGFLVSLFLLPCTSGPYIVILGMLAKQELFAKALMYLIIYNLIFVAPMILITLLVYKGYDPKRFENARQKNIRLLHLIAGIILIGLGVLLLI